MATDDDRRANCEYHEWSVEISVGKTKVKLNLPKIINTSVLQEEDGIVVRSSSFSDSKRSWKA